ncbi:MAG: hypothetical protein MK078_15085 [Crocinitomicaceae bacterium]|nr:hypothetical protein [Crocinitomicaceae bacterium]
MKTFLVYLLLILPCLSFGMDEEDMAEMDAYEAELSGVLNELRNAETDNEREMHNTVLIEKLRIMLRKPGVMEYPFAELTSMSTISAPDGAFRLFNWNVENESQVHSHYCFVVKPGRSKNTVIELKEDNITIPRHPEQMLTSQNWYGALYYNIIPIKKGSKTLYTVMGYAGNDRSTNEKLLDVFYFKGKSLRMGYPLFQESKGSSVLLKRVFFEYSNTAYMALNMNDKLGRIVFDHLSPESPSMKGFREYYVPDMSYDGYFWNGSHWEYQEDVIAYNDPNKRYKAYKPGSLSINDTTDAEYIDVKDKWENPVDNANPIENGGNAIAPIETYDPNTGKKKTKKKRNKRTKKRRNLFGRKKGKPRSAIGND